MQHKDEIFATEKKDLKKEKIGSGDKPVFDNVIENNIFRWFLDVRDMGIPVTNNLIACRAIFEKNNMTTEIKCTFSSGWIRNFKDKFNIVTRKGGSKIIRNNDCELTIIINFIKFVNEKINSGIYYAIINIDETGLYYDYPIDFTLDLKGKKCVEIITTVREKDRITIVLGVDLLNNIKMKPLIIFKGKTKRCLNNIPTNDAYNLSYQENAWCSENQFIQFLSSLPKNKKILLLCDKYR